MTSDSTTQKQELLFKLQELLSKLREKCQEANIKIDINDEKRSITIDLPIDNKETKKLKLRKREAPRELNLLEMLVETPFENFRCISNYKAIWSKELGLIEAIIETNQPDTRYALSSAFSKYDEEKEKSRIEIESDSDRFQNIKISIGRSSKTIGIIDFLQETLESARRTIIFTDDTEKYITRSSSIMIENLKLDNQEQALRILERIANALFFQVDNQGLPIYLAAEQERIERRSRRIQLDSHSLNFPEYQYETEPMSLYWYASSATTMPLLQYLAYYQVIEFFFPRYAEKEVNDIIKRKLKDPSFENNIDSNIKKLLSSIKPYIGKSGFYIEVEAIKSVLRACVSDDEVDQFVKENSERHKFFITYKDKSNKDQSEWKTISEQNIFSGNPNTDRDLVLNTALRIYKIRCRIVHTKSAETDRQLEPLLPFSREAEKLKHDIALVRFIARKVITASGEQLTLR